MRNFIITFAPFWAICAVVCGAMSIVSCGPTQEDPGPSKMHTVQENGHEVLYDENQKAYDDVFLGMDQETVEPLLQNTEIRGTIYRMIPEYSTDRKLNSLYLRSNDLHITNRKKVAQELSTVLKHKYGVPIFDKLSESTDLGLPDRENIRGHQVRWGAHWRFQSKYLVMGIEDQDSTSNVWLWIFNEDVWNNQGGAKAQEDIMNF